MLRVTTTWTGVPGAPYYTALYFEGTDEASAAGVHAAVAELWAYFAGRIRNDLLPTVQPEVDVVDPATGLVTATFIQTAVPVPMSGVDTRQPLVIQGLVRLRTGLYLGGREVRGKVFIPGSMDPDDNQGVPAATYIQRLNEGFSALIADTAALAAPLLVWSPTKGATGVVTAPSAWNQWAILRSRRD